MKCIKCGEEHDGSYGSGSYCSKKCSQSRQLNYKTIYAEKKEIECIMCGEKMSVTKSCSKKNTICESCKIKNNTYTCENCNTVFYRAGGFKRGRKIHCEKCIYKVKHSKKYDNKDLSALNIMELSSKTISKILKRADIGCSLCGWKKASCDIHHIIPKKNGGTNRHDNLIIVCPNCHRELHNNSSYDVSFLRSKSISNIFNNWSDFYHTSH